MVRYSSARRALTSHGVKKDGGLSPVLFNLVLEKIIPEKIHEKFVGIQVKGDNITHLVYADDGLTVLL